MLIASARLEGLREIRSIMITLNFSPPSPLYSEYPHHTICSSWSFNGSNNFLLVCLGFCVWTIRFNSIWVLPQIILTLEKTKKKNNWGQVYGTTWTSCKVLKFVECHWDFTFSWRYAISSFWIFEPQGREELLRSSIELRYQLAINKISKSLQTAWFISGFKVIKGSQT